jgi:hypothetical protein
MDHAAHLPWLAAHVELQVGGILEHLAGLGEHRLAGGRERDPLGALPDAQLHPEDLLELVDRRPHRGADNPSRAAAATIVPVSATATKAASCCIVYDGTPDDPGHALTLHGAAIHRETGTAPSVGLRPAALHIAPYAVRQGQWSRDRPAATPPAPPAHPGEPTVPGGSTAYRAGRRRADRARRATERPPTDPIPVWTSPDGVDRATGQAVVDLTLRVGVALLATGAPAREVVSRTLRLARAYGLRSIHVDVTFSSLTVSYHRGPQADPMTVMRVVRCAVAGLHPLPAAA